MPRLPRKKSVTKIYHVVVKGNDRQTIFEENKDYKKYLDLLKSYKEECHFKLFAYSLMTNHVHLILQVLDTSLETIFRKINTNYAIWFNKKYDRTGHLQNGRFYSEPIEDVTYLINAIRYVHLNPTKAGLESSPGTNYRWSSIYEYRLDKNNLVDTQFIHSLYSQKELETYTTLPDKPVYIDIDNMHKRLTDSESKDIIFRECSCANATDIALLPITIRNSYLIKLHNLGLSIRQLNRLTGVPRGVIERVITKSHLPKTI